MSSLSDQNKVLPLISIIMAVYNREAYIRRAVDSVLNQSYKNWELIAVDDGSKDDSALILESCRKNNSKIKVIYQEHKFLPAARNNGIKNSNGDFITFLDSDDEYTTDQILQRVNYLTEHTDIDLLHGGVKIIGNEYVPDKDDPVKLVHLSECTIGATFFGKRNVFVDLKGFKDIKYSEDSEFLERANKIYKVKKVNFPTYIYHRDVPDSITNKMKKNEK
ncbi:MAG: glycosyltransferase family A protein [Ignavibacteriaceae bacterium]|jgi:glycosyltransferase involved in cell wall biosynthesis|nr:glycosyltransferase family A protein [Ignavibacteriaceae bacterium]